MDGVTELLRGHDATPLCILVAEDEALVALSLSDLFEAEGHDVVLASDGAEALAQARHMGDSLDVLVTDLNMPRLGGEDLIRVLRAERPGLPVVVVTGSPPPGGQEELRRAGGGHGPLALLHKPVDYAGLVETLRRVAPAGRSGWAGHGGCSRLAVPPGGGTR